MRAAGHLQSTQRSSSGWFVDKCLSKSDFRVGSEGQSQSSLDFLRVFRLFKTINVEIKFK